MSVARATVAELLSPQIFGATGEHLAPGYVLDVRSHGCGTMSDLLIEAGKTKVRQKVTCEKPYIVMGACLDRWHTVADGGISDAKSITKSC